MFFSTYAALIHNSVYGWWGLRPLRRLSFLLSYPLINSSHDYRAHTTAKVDPDREVYRLFPANIISKCH